MSGNSLINLRFFFPESRFQAWPLYLYSTDAIKEYGGQVREP